MLYPACRHENPAQAKFCLECGARLVVSCSNCHAELPPSAKFCLECGERVTPSGAITVSPSASPEAYTPKHLAERILTAKAAVSSAQMDGVYFPITTREFAADVQYRALAEGEHDIGGVRVRTMLLSHPGNCLGYRLEYAGRRLCYVTDNELYPKDSPFRSDEYVERLVDFCRDANVLITDCTCADEEYARHMHWGLSSVSQVAELAWRACVRSLYLVHHGPGQNDVAIDAKLARAQAWLAERGAGTQVAAPVKLAKIEV